MTGRKKSNFPFLHVIIISLVIHVVGFLVFGSFVVYQTFKPPEVSFEAPPRAAQDKPEKKRHQMVVLSKQKKSHKPKQTIQVLGLSMLKMPSIEVHVPNVPQIISMNISHLSRGIDLGFRPDGIELTYSTVDFFGIKSSGENVLFILDIAKSMLEADRGDVWGFTRVKEEVGKMIEDLKPGTLFNVYAYSNGLDVLSQKPLPATLNNKNKAGKWIDQYWKYEGNQFVGWNSPQLKNYTPDFDGFDIRRTVLKRSGDKDDPETTYHLEPMAKVNGKDYGHGSSRMDLALFAAFENKADAIFLITHGKPRVGKDYTEQGLNDYRLRLDAYFRDFNQNQDSPEYQQYQAAVADLKKRVAAYKQARKEKGLPPEIHQGWLPKGFKWPKAPAGPRFPRYWPYFTTKEFVQMIYDKAKIEYDEKANMKRPPIHVIGYSTTEKSEKILREIQKKFPGSKFRHIGEKDLKESMPQKPQS